MSPENEKLFDEFPPVLKDQWKDAVTKELKGKEFDKLVTRADGIEIQPYHTLEDTSTLPHITSHPGSFPFVRGNRTKGNHWEIRQNIEVKDAEKANKIALNALMNGATSLGFVINDFSFDEKQMSLLLKDILIEHVAINFIAGHQSPEILNAFIKEVKKREIAASQVQGSVDFDPLGELAITGNWKENKEAAFQGATQLINVLKQESPMFQGININVQYFHNAGASIVQELGIGLAQGNEYLALLTEKGLKIDDITAGLRFTFGIGLNYFLEIAKIRAARMLWAKIVEQYKPGHDCSCATFIHCTTSAWNATVFDPYVNLLRATTQVMSAAIGGADSISVIPFDTFYESPGDLSERIARNTQIIIGEEAYLNKVADPAGGSYHIEKLTDSIAQGAWEIFKEIEAKGGFIASLEDGYIQSEIEKTAAKKDEAISSGKIVLLGTNKHPDKSEKMPGQIQGINIKATSKEFYIKPLKQYRAAEKLEQERLQKGTEALERKNN